MYIYIYETRFLTPKEEQQLRVFEDKYSVVQDCNSDTFSLLQHEGKRCEVNSVQ
jgi:hypothetical protein